MRVGFDAHMVGRQETGNETYARGLLEGFEALGFPVDVYSFTRIPSEVHRNHRIWPSQSIVRIPISLPLLTIRDSLTLYHGTYILPPVLRCPSIVTVHDITYALHPEWFPRAVQRRLAMLVPLAIRRAKRVITVSEHSKADIIERYDVPPHKVVVTYEAPRAEFAFPVERRENTQPFLLYVGNIQPRKNFGTILRALAIARQRGTRIRLIVAGSPGFQADDMVKLTHELSIDDAVEFRGYVSDDVLRSLYASCTALVHPALYEGFGLTPLEAMAQGAPVLVANTSSIPEVVGDAALLLPPLDPEAWADAMARVLHDRTLRDDLTSRGWVQSKRFSWERCARETVNVYRAVDAE